MSFERISAFLTPSSDERLDSVALHPALAVPPRPLAGLGAHQELQPRPANCALHSGQAGARNTDPWYAGRDGIGRWVPRGDSAEQLALRDALAASETNHQALLDTLEVGVFVALDGRFVATNAALRTLLGHCEEDFLDLSFAQVVAPEYLALWLQRMRSRSPLGAAERRCDRLRMLPRHGTQAVWVDLQVRPGLYLGQRCVLGVVQDVTERRCAEQHAQLRALVQERLGTAAELEGLLDAIVVGTEDMLSDTRCALLVREPGALHLRLAGSASLPEPMRAALDKLPWAEAGLCALATQSDHTVVCEDLGQAGGTPAFMVAVAASALRASWSTPIVGAAGAVLGVFVAYRDMPGAPCPGDAASLAHSAQLAAVAIERHQADAQ